MDKVEIYEKALMEIREKGGWKIRGTVANELSKIADDALIKAQNQEEED